MRLTDYATLVFDCDGVVLDSNRVKTEAFRRAALPYGPAAAEALVAHHVANGGVSRYAKFAHFLSHIVPPHTAGPPLQALLDTFAAEVRQGLMTCEVASGLGELRAATPQARWMIVSGGDQAELREIFAARGLAAHFDAGIFGSPDSKEAILTRELAGGNLRSPALYLGDSRYDHDAAASHRLDFVFLSRWSEMADLRPFAQSNAIPVCDDLCTLLKLASRTEKQIDEVDDRRA
jgi:phosphoglycolate phosphatase-like HAD superfamily hydrolase